MTKEELLALWNANSWEVETWGIFFIVHQAERELYISCSGYTEDEVLALSFWKQLVQNLEKLDQQAHNILQKEFPNDEEILSLPLTDIILDKSGCYGVFALSYDAGDSPAGELYLNVSFNENFVPSQVVGYDTF